MFLACGYCGFLMGVNSSREKPAENPLNQQIETKPPSAAGRIVQNNDLELGGQQDKAVRVDSREKSWDYISVPAKTINNLITNPFSPSLVPNQQFLLALEMDPKQIKSTTVAFNKFKQSLEQMEIANSKLIQGKDGDHIEISPYPFPQSEFSRLRDDLITITGKDDWRVGLLMGCLDNMNNTGGMGRYRQEIAIEKHEDYGGGAYDMIKVRAYNSEGMHVLMGGFGLKAGVPVDRYSQLFQKYSGQ